MLEIFGSRFGRLVGMNADGRDKRLVAIREANASLEIGRAVAGSDGNHPLDACIESALDDCVAVGIEFRAIEMAV
jgi:hypothetical protein